MLPFQEEPAAVKEPTEFTVKLTAFDATAKVKLIKQVKIVMPDMNLVQVGQIMASVVSIFKRVSAHFSLKVTFYLRGLFKNASLGFLQVNFESNILDGLYLFTPKSDQLQFSLSVSHQRYIIQYGEFGNR